MCEPTTVALTMASLAPAPPDTPRSPEGQAPEKEKAPESREPSVKFKLPSLRFSPRRRRR